jgi:hypothetical protein
MKTKTTVEHLDELIVFYTTTETQDVNQLKKMIVRNLNDVRKRRVKEIEGEEER